MKLKKLLVTVLIGLSIFACGNKQGEKLLKEKHSESKVSTNYKNGTVIKVYDGDTVTLADNTKLRLYGIDAPEKKQEGGAYSQQLLYSKIFGKQIQYEPINIDRYGRTVAKIYYNGDYVNEYMIKSGGAWFYEEYAKNDNNLKKAFQYAQKNNIGIFKNKKAINPAFYRRSHKR